MIDLHSHILPGLDDGPDDLDGSLALARAAVASGTTTIAATPHIDSMGIRPTDRDAPLARLRAAIAAEGIALTVIPGGEIALDRWVDLTSDELASLRLGDGEFLLLECPLSVAAGPFDRVVATLLSRGVRVLLAHPERCPSFQRNPERLATLVRAGALAQITGASLTGQFGRTPREAALHMVSEGLAHDLSSDAHDTTHRGPDLRAGLTAMAQALPGAGALSDWLTVDVPRAIIGGADIPPRPAVTITPPGRWRSLRDRFSRKR